MGVHLIYDYRFSISKRLRGDGREGSRSIGALFLDALCYSHFHLDVPWLGFTSTINLPWLVLAHLALAGLILDFAQHALACGIDLS